MGCEEVAGNEIGEDESIMSVRVIVHSQVQYRLFITNGILVTEFPRFGEVLFGLFGQQDFGHWIYLNGLTST